MKELSRPKRAGTIKSFWTSGGRIFLKIDERGPKHLDWIALELWITGLTPLNF